MSLTMNQIINTNDGEGEGSSTVIEKETITNNHYFVDNAEIYSEEEKVVGCWTNGKPLYRRVICKTPVATAANQVIADLSAMGVDHVIEVTGYLRRSDGVIIPLPQHRYVSVSEVYLNYGIVVSAEGLVYLTIESESERSSTVYLTVKYTKTTDAENSYVPVQANNYSLDEQIIGTWIDGKPLYRKVYLCKTPSSNTSENVVDITDLDYETLTNLYSIIGNYVVSNVSTCYSASGFHATTSLGLIDGRSYIRMVVYNAFHNMNATVIIEYTKTTD